MYSAEAASNRYGIRTDRIHVVLNPLDLSLFDGGHVRAERDATRRIVFAGRLSDEQKGVDVLLAALDMVLREVPDVEFRLAGGGDLPKVAMSQEAESHIRLLGPISRHRLAAEYAAADLAVVPSRWESFGYAAAEAMASGLAVAASRVGALPELVEHGRTGLLVPPADAPALAEAIVALLRLGELRRSMGDEGRQRIRELCDLDLIVDQMLAAYHGVMTGGSQGAVPSTSRGPHKARTA
jgi:glycosyltransferase involved in cell wall biosynthesis